MPDIRRRGGDGEREILYTKAVGSAAAFALLVMWMTPPTTPHPAAPSPLLAFKTMHSDAPTLDAAAGLFAAPADAASVIPWWSPRAPQASPPRDEPVATATALTEVVMSDEATDDAPSDAQDTVQSPPTGRPPVALARAGTTPQAAQPRYLPRTETISARPADDGQVQEAAAEAGE